MVKKYRVEIMKNDELIQSMIVSYLEGIREDLIHDFGKNVEYTITDINKNAIVMRRSLYRGMGIDDTGREKSYEKLIKKVIEMKKEGEDTYRASHKLHLAEGFIRELFKFDTEEDMKNYLKRVGLT